MPPLVLGTVLLLGLLVFSGALGRRVIRWANVRPHSTLVAVVLSCAAGLGLLQFLPFLLFSVGIGSRPAFVLVTSVFALTLIPEIRRIPSAAARLIRDAVSLPPWERFMVFSVMAMLMAVYLRALCPITDHDGLSYHLTTAIRYLAAERFVYIPTITPTNWPLGVESLFALLLAFHSEAPVAIIQFTFGALIVALSFLLAAHFGGRTAGWIAIALLMLYHGIWRQMAMAHVDLGTMLFCTASIYSAVRWKSGGRDWLDVAALFAGLGATTKLTGFWTVAALTLAVFLELREEPLRRRFTIPARVAAIGFVIVLPWFVRAWALTGNPIYPILNQTLGGIEYSPQGWERYQHCHLLFNTIPGIEATPQGLRIAHGIVASLGILLALVITVATHNSLFAIPLRIAAFFVAGISIGSYVNPRFILGALPPVAAFLAWKLKGISPNLIRVTGLVIAFLAIRISISSVDPSIREACAVAWSSHRAQEYLAAAVPDFEIAQFANRALHVSDRILVATWEKNTVHYKNQSYWPDYWLQDSIHYDDPARLESDLKRLGITHIVFRPIDYEWCERSHVCKGRRDAETVMLGSLVKRRGTLLHRVGEVSLYGLNWSVSEASLSKEYEP